MREILTAVAIAAALAGCVVVTAPPPTGEVTQREFEVLRVYDGDTFVIRYDAEETKVRIFGISAPEVRPVQAGGPEAREALKRLIGGKVVRLEIVKKRGAFGRIIARVYVAGPGGGEIDVGRWMLDEGWAKVYDRR